MNFCIITGKIIRQPKIYRINKTYYIFMIFNARKIANQNTQLLLCLYDMVYSLKYFYSLYKQNQDIIITGCLYKPKKCMINNTMISNYFKQYVWIKLDKIYE